MKIPYTLLKELDENSINVWNDVFLPTKGSNNDKTVEQSLWRRNQTERNKEMSGWSGPNDKARKILYYKHEYGLTSVEGKQHLALLSTYIYFCLTLPKDKLRHYMNAIEKGISLAGWKYTNPVYSLGDLRLTINHYPEPDKRASEYLDFPAN